MKPHAKAADSARQTPFEDPRDIVTPHAFKLDSRLLGLPLADPKRRGFAILIDFILVTMVSQAGGVLLGLAMAIMVFDMWKTKGSTTRTRALLYPLRLLGALMVFGVAVAVIQPLWEKYAPTDDDGDGDARRKPKVSTNLELTPAEIVGFTELVVSLHKCPDAICRVEKTEALTNLVKSSKMAPDEKREALTDLIRDVAEDKREQVALTKVIDHGLNGTTAKDTPATTAPSDPETEHLRQELAAEKAHVKELEASNESLQSANKGFGIIKTLRNFVFEDLGLSLGWAAVYFTVFTAWWRGQTPGKRLLRIRVVNLNGKPITLWDAFSRYGGYAAGFATGLLGFFQCFWDPNRQAIHDKISFTVVIHDPHGDALEKAKHQDADFGDFLDDVEGAIDEPETAHGQDKIESR